MCNSARSGHLHIAVFICRRRFRRCAADREGRTAPDAFPSAAPIRIIHGAVAARTEPAAAPPSSPPTASEKPVAPVYANVIARRLTPQMTTAPSPYPWPAHSSTAPSAVTSRPPPAGSPDDRPAAAEIQRDRHRQRHHRRRAAHRRLRRGAAERGLRRRAVHPPLRRRHTPVDLVSHGVTFPAGSRVVVGRAARLGTASATATAST